MPAGFLDPNSRRLSLRRRRWDASGRLETLHRLRCFWRRTSQGILLASSFWPLEEFDKSGATLSFFSSGVLPNQVVRSSVTTALKTDLTWGVNRYRMSMTEMKRLEMVACRGLKTNSRAENLWSRVSPNSYNARRRFRSNMPGRRSVGKARTSTAEIQLH